MINRKSRFATEGIRFQRHNGDGTIPTPHRFVGFAHTVDLRKVLSGGRGSLSIQIDSDPKLTRVLDFSHAQNLARVTVNEALIALEKPATEFPDIRWEVDTYTGRIRGGYNSGTATVLEMQVQNNTGAVVIIPADTYALDYEGEEFRCNLTNAVTIEDTNSTRMRFIAIHLGKQELLPAVNEMVNLLSITPLLPMTNHPDFFAQYTVVAPGSEPDRVPQIIQVTGELAAAMDFGNCIAHGGNGLEVISFFEDQTISIGLPKDIKDKEEIDIEGAKGSITRMVIGAMVQGLSPVVTLKQKDYNLLELIQGGKLDRTKGTYEPPLSKDADPPSFWAEIFSGVYSQGSNKLSDTAGYERILLRSCIGIEADVPIEAKAWATYAFNLTATEYTDETGVSLAAWQEQSMTLEDFDALKVKEVSN